jgi:hypothetical protein
VVVGLERIRWSTRSTRPTMAPGVVGHVAALRAQKIARFSCRRVALVRYSGSSPEIGYVASAAGWEVAFDGMEITL